MRALMRHINMVITIPEQKFVNVFSGNAMGIYVRDDGLKLYIMNFISAGNSRIYEYDFTTAYDLTSLVLKQYRAISPPTTSAVGVTFKSDGLTFIIWDNSYRGWYSFSLSTAWDISTVITTSSKKLETVSNIGISLVNNGNNLIKANLDLGYLMMYSLTSGNIATLSLIYTKQLIPITPTLIYVNASDFNSDGTKLYVCDNGTQKIFIYSLSTPFNISTVSYIGYIPTGRTGYLSGCKVVNDTYIYISENHWMYRLDI